MRVAADLIQVRDQTQLWGDSFEREMAGILALQNDVAREVAKVLALKLLPSEQALLAKARPVNPEAHDAFLRGHFYVMKIAPGDLDIAEKYLDLALEKDPTYAPAYAGRAWMWSVRRAFGYSAPEEAGPKAKAAALRAIELDDNLAAAHEALAVVRWAIEWDWDGAWESFRRAVELNPNSAFAQGNYAWLLLTMGQREEALVRMEKAVVLDPFNPLVHGWHALFLYCRRRYDEAISAAREAQRFQQDHPVALGALWLAYHGKGMEKEALEAAKDNAKVTYNDPRIQAAIDEGYAQGGYAEAMKRAAEAMVARLPEAISLPSDIATYYALAGEKEETIEWLKRGFEVRDFGLVCIGCYPHFDDLHPDPRFQDLLRKMNLPVRTGKSR